MTISFNLIQTHLCIWFEAYKLINVFQITYIILMACIQNWFYNYIAYSEWIAQNNNLKEQKNIEQVRANQW